jgi:hypothetical protein
VGEWLELTVKEYGERRDLLLKEESDSRGINSKRVKLVVALLSCVLANTEGI